MRCSMLALFFYFYFIFFRSKNRKLRRISPSVFYHFLTNLIMLKKLFSCFHKWQVFSNPNVSRRTCNKCGKNQYFNTVQGQWYEIGNGYHNQKFIQ